STTRTSGASERAASSATARPMLDASFHAGTTARRLRRVIRRSSYNSAIPRATRRGLHAAKSAWQHPPMQGLLVSFRLGGLGGLGGFGLALCCACGSPPPSTSVPRAEPCPNVALSIVATNDVHGQ